MIISISGKHIDMSDALKNHVEGGLKQTVEKFSVDPAEVSVTFSKTTHLFDVDVSLHMKKGLFIRAHGSGDTAYASMDNCISKIETRLSKHRKKLHHHQKHRDTHITKEEALKYIISTQEEEHNHEPIIVAELKTDIPLLSVSEAVMQMDLADLAAMMFKNSSHGRLNVVYRRPDGHVGWIDPQV